MSEWNIFRLEELGRIITGYTPITTDLDGWIGNILFYSPSDFGDTVYCASTERTVSPKSVVTNRAVLPNTILVTCIGSTIGKMAIAKYTGITNQQINALICSERFDPVFSYYNLKFNIRKLYALHGATAIPIVNKSQFSQISLQFPPLPTQRKIARILSTIDGQIEKTEAIIAKYQAVKQGMLQDLFTRGIDVRTGQLRPCYEDAPELYKESALGMIPKEWEAFEIRQVCDLVKDGTHLPPKRVDDGVWLLGVTNIISGRLELTASDTKVPVKFYEQMHKNWRLMTGDVLLAIVGATIGKVTQIPEDFPTFTLQRSVCVLRGSSVLYNDYLRAYLESEFFQTALWNEVSVTAQPGIYLDAIKNFILPLPTMLEQQKIIQEINSINNIIDSEKASLQKNTLLKQGLMQDLLSGKVEVTA